MNTLTQLHFPLILAQTLSGLSIAQWAIIILVAAGIIAIVAIVLRQLNVAVPAFIIQILWVLLAVIIGVLAIKFLLSIW